MLFKTLLIFVAAQGYAEGFSQPQCCAGNLQISLGLLNGIGNYFPSSCTGVRDYVDLCYAAATDISKSELNAFLSLNVEFSAYLDACTNLVLGINGTLSIAIKAEVNVLVALIAQYKKTQGVSNCVFTGDNNLYLLGVTQQPKTLIVLNSLPNTITHVLSIVGGLVNSVLSFVGNLLFSIFDNTLGIIILHVVNLIRLLVNNVLCLVNNLLLALLGPNCFGKYTCTVSSTTNLEIVSICKSIELQINIIVNLIKTKGVDQCITCLKNKYTTINTCTNFGCVKQLCTP